jgi:hypothetical protein
MTADNFSEDRKLSATSEDRTGNLQGVNAQHCVQDNHDRMDIEDIVLSNPEFFVPKITQKSFLQSFIKDRKEE